MHPEAALAPAGAALFAPASSISDSEVRRWVADNVSAPNTRKTYNTYHKQFQAFCEQTHSTFFPATPATIVAFLRHLMLEKGLAASTIVRPALSAIANDYRLSGIPSPTTDPLVKAAKVIISREGRPENPKRPLTPDLVLRMAEAALQDGSPIATRDMCMTTMMMAGFLRESELVSLRYGSADAERDAWLETVTLADGSSQEVLWLFVQKSKTDQCRQGHTIVIGPATNPVVCPVAWFRRWLLIRNPAATHLFHVADGVRSLSHSTPCGRVQYWLTKIGVDAKAYGSHSGRRGGASAAAARGVEERLLRRHGNWRSTAIYKYISESVDRQLSVSQAVFAGV